MNTPSSRWGRHFQWMTQNFNFAWVNKQRLIRKLKWNDWPEINNLVLLFFFFFSSSLVFLFIKLAIIENRIHCATGMLLSSPPTQVFSAAKQRTDCYNCGQTIFDRMCDLKQGAQFEWNIFSFSEVLVCWRLVFAVNVSSRCSTEY